MMRSAWLAPLRLALALAVATALAQPQSAVADLTVVSYGAQLLDLASGRTLMEEGGEVIDRSSGVTIVAEWISYLPDVDIEIRGGLLVGPSGTMEAPFMRLDLVAGRIDAWGGVRWRLEPLEVVAEELLVASEGQLAALRGAVTGIEPPLQARELWIDLEDLRLLLFGPYEYRDGPLLLAGGEAAVLQIDPLWEGEEGARVATDFDARSEADAELLQRALEESSGWPSRSVEP